MKNRILLDTNFLMMPYKDGIDIFREIDRLMADKQGYELCITKGVENELERIAGAAKGENKVAASLGIQLIADKKVKVIGADAGFSADSEILAIAQENPAATVVCTNDKALKRRLRDIGVAVMSMRTKDHLDFI